MKTATPTTRCAACRSRALPIAEIVEEPEALHRVGVSVWERYTGPYTDECKPMVDQMMNKRVGVRIVARRTRSWDHRKLGLPHMSVGGSTAP